MLDRRTALTAISCFAARQVLAAPSSRPIKVIDQSVSWLADRIRSQELQSVEVVGAFLDRISAVNDELNAVVQLRAEAALQDARQRDLEIRQGHVRGPLHGVPFTVKDSFDTQGVVSTAGTVGRKNHVPERDATVVQRLKQAGGVLLGKTNTPELTLSYDTFNLVYGRTRNPYDLSRTPGGSSGGAAAILAASGSPLDIGSDTAGSIRVPSHFCGIAGLKPTTGSVPRTGHIISFDGPLQSLTHIGPMARFVADLRLVFSIIAGRDHADPHIAPALPHTYPSDAKELRVAFFKSNRLCEASADTQSAVQAAVDALQPHVASTTEMSPQLLEVAHAYYQRLNSADGLDWVMRRLRRTKSRKSSLGYLRKPPPSVTATELTQLLELWDQLKSKGLQVWEECDAIVCPVAATPAFEIGASTPVELFSYATPANVLGWPAVVLPTGTTSGGLPIGVQILAPLWREDIALRLAEILEQELGGWHRASVPA